jgi:hypothetical protein
MCVMYSSYYNEKSAARWQVTSNKQKYMFVFGGLGLGYNKVNSQAHVSRRVDVVKQAG